MRSTWVVFRRELFSIFATARGYAILATFTAISAFYFFNLLGRFNFLVSRAAGMELDATITVPTLHEFVVVRFLQMLLLAFVLFVPLLTMRTFAEERKEGTFAMLKTAPIGIASVVLGKFLAIAVLLFLMIAIAGAFLAVLAVFGSPDRGCIIAGLIGLYLCSLFYAALGMLLGARTDHQLTAAVSAMVVLGLLSLLHTPIQILPELRSTLGYLAPFIHIDAFTRGALPLAGTGYFVLLTGLSLFGCQRFLVTEDGGSVVLEPSTGKPASGLTRMAFPISGVFAATGVTLGLVLETWRTPLVLGHLLLAVMLLAWRATPILSASRRKPNAELHCAELHRGFLSLPVLVMLALLVLSLSSSRYLDVSDLHRNTLSEFGKSVVQRISEPLEILYFSKRDLELDRAIEHRLTVLQQANPMRLTVRTVDSLLFPNLVNQFGLRASDRLVLRYGGGPERKAIKLQNIDEDSVVAAILMLIDPTPKRVYLAIGMGLPPLVDEGALGVKKLARALVSENFEVQGISFDNLERVPADADLMIVLGLREPPQPRTLTALSDYLTHGGKLFLCVDPLFAHYFEPLFAQLGIQADDSVVLDRDQMAYMQGAVGLQPLVSNFAEHPITNRLDASKVVIMNGVTPLLPRDRTSRASPLFFASPGSIQELRALEILNGTHVPTGSNPNPDSPSIPLAVTVVDSANAPRAVVVGDTDWLLNGALDYYSNRSLALNSIHWLLGNNWALMTRATSVFSQSVAVSAGQFRNLVIASVLVVELLILGGLLRLWQRNW